MGLKSGVSELMAAWLFPAPAYKIVTGGQLNNMGNSFRELPCRKFQGKRNDVFARLYRTGSNYLNSKKSQADFVHICRFVFKDSSGL
jgi:hypothetical protein